MLRELVERAIRVKIDVVVDDLSETGGTDGHPGREVLNYGHTMAHAIERASRTPCRTARPSRWGACSSPSWPAGPAARSGRGRAAPRVLERVGLPTAVVRGVVRGAAATMRVDKKARGSVLRFVVLDDLGRPRILAEPAEADLRAAYDVMVGGRLS